MCIICIHVEADETELVADIMSTARNINCGLCKTITRLSPRWTTVTQLNIDATNIEFLPLSYVNVTYLSARDTPLRIVPGSWTNLIDLDISGCQHMTELPITLTRLTSLRAKGTTLCGIPRELTSLVRVNVNWSVDFCDLPASLTNLQSLKIEETRVANIFSTWTNLQDLNISCTNIAHIPPTLSQLRQLRMKNAKMSNEVMLSLALHPQLQMLDCSSCKDLEFINDSLIRLHTLSMSMTPMVQMLPPLPSLVHLNAISTGLMTLPQGLANLSHCFLLHSQMIRLPDDATGIRFLNCSMCKNLEGVPSTYTNLQELNITGCSQVETIPSGSLGLHTLHASAALKLRELPDTLTNLVEVFCANSLIQSIPASYTSLRDLNCDNCVKLTTLPRSLMLNNLSCMNTPCLINSKMLTRPVNFHASFSPLQQYDFVNHSNRYVYMVNLRKIQRAVRRWIMRKCKQRVAAMQLWRFDLLDLRDKFVSLIYPH